MSHRSSSVEQIYIAMSDFVTSFIYFFVYLEHGEIRINLIESHIRSVNEIQHRYRR